MQKVFKTPSPLTYAGADLSPEEEEEITKDLEKEWL